MKITLFSAIAVAVALVPSQAFACGLISPTFLEKIEPALDAELLNRKADIFVRFNSDIYALNRTISTMETRAKSTEGTGKEPVFDSLQEAATNREEGTRFYLQIDLRTGDVTEVFNLELQPMARSTDRCIGPVGFLDVVAK